MRPITQRELRNRSGEIMRAVYRGETFTVTRNGVPVGELRPVRQQSFVGREIVTAAFAGAPSVDLGRFVADVDAVLDQTLASGA
jgi:prevent-host-death family protein